MYSILNFIEWLLIGLIWNSENYSLWLLIDSSLGERKNLIDSRVDICMELNIANDSQQCVMSDIAFLLSLKLCSPNTAGRFTACLRQLFKVDDGRCPSMQNPTLS